LRGKQAEIGLAKGELMLLEEVLPLSSCHLPLASCRIGFIELLAAELLTAYFQATRDSIC